MTPVAALLNDAINYLAVDAADHDANPYKKRFSCDAVQMAYRKGRTARGIPWLPFKVRRSLCKSWAATSWVARTICTLRMATTFATLSLPQKASKPEPCG